MTTPTSGTGYEGPHTRRLRLAQIQTCREDADRHGNVRVYFRRKGRPKIRLNEVPGTPAFDQEYQRAFRGELVTAPASTTRRTFAMLGSMQ
jgi:hypothetical protein